MMTNRKVQIGKSHTGKIVAANWMSDHARNAVSGGHAINFSPPQFGEEAVHRTRFEAARAERKFRRYLAISF